MKINSLKDECRKNLNIYTTTAFSVIPEIASPLLLDAGCGTGVSSIALAQLCDGVIYAVDNNKASLDLFKEKVTSLHLEERITIIDDTILNTSLFDFKFDIILAEGLLNAIGFERGLKIFLNILKAGGYLLIHDELKGDEKKRNHFAKHNLQVLHSFTLLEDVWLNKYFLCLEKKIEMIDDKKIKEKELSTINAFKKHPHNLRSIYYVLQHQYHQRENPAS